MALYAPHYGVGKMVSDYILPWAVADLKSDTFIVSFSDQLFSDTTAKLQCDTFLCCFTASDSSQRDLVFTKFHGSGLGVREPLVAVGYEKAHGRVDHPLA